jgi:hypothetical protein
METIILNKKDFEDLKETINCAYRGDTDIKAIVKNIGRIEVLDTVNSFKSESVDRYEILKSYEHNGTITDEDICYAMAEYHCKMMNSYNINTDESVANEIATLKAKVSQAATFLTGLKDTPDSATIGGLRSFIEANYDNIVR